MFDNDFNTQEEIQEEVIDKSKRTRCTRRKRDAAKALRKQRISRQIYRSTGHEYYQVRRKTPVFRHGDISRLK